MLGLLPELKKRPRQFQHLCGFFGDLGILGLLDQAGCSLSVIGIESLRANL